MSTGGRTMWYCTSCGAALSVGRAVCSCGGKSQPEEALTGTAAYEKTGIVAKLWRRVARAVGWWDGAP